MMLLCDSIAKSGKLANNSTLETESVSFSYYNFNYLTTNIQHGYSQWYHSLWPSNLNVIIVTSILDSYSLGFLQGIWLYHSSLKAVK